MKYLIKARVEVDGIVDKHDIIGAIFGQTEGLLGSDFDLRDLQDKGRIGRIQVDVKVQGSKTSGEISVPSNLDRVETALIAALIESVDRVGPYHARLRVSEIADVRLEKIQKIVERAKDILRTWIRERAIDYREVVKEVAEALKPPEIIEYGPEKLPAGPDVDSSDTIIIVEGRADVLNLLRYGYRNVIALEGAKGAVPKTIIELSKRKKTIAFVDGDHGGELVLRELLRVASVDYVARAPEGKEVEDLTLREISRALKAAVPVKEYLKQERVAQQPKGEARPSTAEAEPSVREEVIAVPEKVLNTIKALNGTLEAVLYNERWEEIKRVPVRDLFDTIKEAEQGSINAVVFDGIITQRLVAMAAEKGVKILIGARMGSLAKRHDGVQILTFNDVV